ncbi:MAG: ABC transporter permease subunit [Cyanobacteria bacterium RI_101]|nr:ABC transporter permease subunit [Cyanobacteria bacterium RI_101]
MSVFAALRWGETRMGRFLSNETLLYVLKRLLQGALTLLLTSLLSFIIIQLAPGSYLDALQQNPRISPETLQELKVQFGLDQPWYVQYWRWLVQVVTQLNFGQSFVYNRSVVSLLWERVPATLLLALSSILVTWSIAIPLGIFGAVKQNTLWDQVLRFFSYLGQGFPSFIAAILLLFVAQNAAPLLPVGNMTSLEFNDFTVPQKIFDILWHLILPTLALSLTSFAGLQRLTRGQLLDVLRQDYIQTARAKGLPENRVIYVHALRNAVNPLITLLGFEFASLLSGAFIAEFFFNWPGLGRLILQAVTAQDLYLVMGSLIMGAALLILGNLLADILLKFVDPRIKLEDL